MALDDKKLVALAIVVREGKDFADVLALKKCKPDSGLLWLFPGGKVESGESIRAAARRELHEETGLLAYKATCLGKRIHPKTDREVYYIGLKYKSGEIDLEANFEAAEWVPVRDLEEKMGPDIYQGVLVYLGLRSPNSCKTIDCSTREIGTLVENPCAYGSNLVEAG